MQKLEHLPHTHAASVDRITKAEHNRFGQKSQAEHKAAEKEFSAALAAHSEIFGKPFKRNGAWQ